MLGFKKPDRHNGVLSGVASTLPGILSGLHPVERATVLLAANCMIAFAARSEGVAIDRDPRRVDAKSANKLLDYLVQVRDGMAALRDDARDAQRRHISCHLHATELVMLTTGLAMGTSHAKAIAGCWKTIWSSRESLRQAVPWVRKYERATGQDVVPALPDGRSPTDIDLMKMGMSIPAFLRRRRA